MSNYAVVMGVRVVAMLVSSGMAGLGMIIGENNCQKAAGVREEMLLVCWLTSAVMGSLVLLLNGAFVRLWAGPDYFIGASENVMMVLVMVQLVFIRADAFVLDAALHVRAKVVLAFVSAFVAGGLAYCFGLTFTSPVTGVMTGLLSGRMLLTVCYPVLATRTLTGDSGWKIMSRSGVRMMMMSAAQFAACYVLGTYMRCDSWFVLVGYGAAGTICNGVSAATMGLSASERARLLKRLEEIAPFRRIVDLVR